MSVFLDLSSISDTSNGTQDLFSISWNDTHLNQGATTTIATSAGTINVAQVLYPAQDPTSAGKGSADRLFTLVNTSTGLNWTSPILITPMDTAVNSTNPYNGDDMTGNGETFIDSAHPVIHVCYDTNQCNQAGIAAFDTGNNPIATPNCVILYHELSHAYHYAINQIPYEPGMICSGNSSDEPAAETDENVMRTELGLCLRDVCNHDVQCSSGDSCGGSATPGGPPITGSGSSGPGGGGCFIVSAATGSPHSREVMQLRQLRDRISVLSSLSAQLIDGVYLEYFKFSPGIAKEISRNYAARIAARRVIVRPLFAWYTLATTLGLDWNNRVAVNVAAQNLLDACPRSLAKSVVGPILGAIQSGSPLPAVAPAHLRRYLPRVRQAMQLPLARWAILDPLVRAWTLTTRHADVVREVAEWMANAPLERFTPPRDPQSLDKEIETLAGFLGFQPALRAQLGTRLAKAWPQGAGSLQRHGFITR